MEVEGEVVGQGVTESVTVFVEMAGGFGCGQRPGGYGAAGFWRQTELRLPLKFARRICQSRGRHRGLSVSGGRRCSAQLFPNLTDDYRTHHALIICCYGNLYSCGQACI